MSIIKRNSKGKFIRGNKIKLGTHHSKETRKLISKNNGCGMKGKTHTKDVRIKLSLAKLSNNNPQYRSNLEEFRTFSYLYNQYIAKGLSLSQLSKQIGISIGCLVQWLNKVGIHRRQCGARLGINNNNFKGKKINSQGYVLIYSPKHPNHDSGRYVREHILNVENFLGRYLSEEEIIHHIDGNKQNNELSNLYLFSNTSSHTYYHRSKSSIPIEHSNLSKFK